MQLLFPFLLDQPQANRVPHLRDGFIFAKVGMYTLSQPALALAVVLAVVVACLRRHSEPKGEEPRIYEGAKRPERLTRQTATPPAASPPATPP